MAGKIKMGFSVGVDEDGDFQFVLHGDELGVVQLLGLERYAGIRVKEIVESQLSQAVTKPVDAEED